MYTITEALARYTKWDIEKQALHVREGHPDNSPSSSEWADSDDEGVELTHVLADLLRQPVVVWSLTVHDPNHRSTTVHNTEEACWESLRVNYDPEDEYVLESPVEIVETLERRQGLTIDIDKHEVTR